MISIVVPIFNEEEIVELFHEALTDSMKELRSLGGRLCKRRLQRLVPETADRTAGQRCARGGGRPVA